MSTEGRPLSSESVGNASLAVAEVPRWIARPTSSTCTPTTRAATCSPTATPSRRRTSSGWPSRACCSARRSAPPRPARRAAPACSPASTRTPTGCSGLAHRGWSLNDYSHHIVHTLREAGYHSVLIGEQHISKQPGRDRLRPGGQDRHHPRERRRAGRRSTCCASPPDQPFFLSVGLLRDPPRVLRARVGRRRATVLPPPNLPDTPETRRDMAAFKASARSLDQRRRARCSSALDELGLADDTLVICTTDHGMAFPGAKATLTDRGIGVLLILRGPGGFDGGKVIDALVSHIDLYPDDLRPGRDRAPGLPPGRVAAAAGPRRARRRCATRSSPRAPTTPPTSPSARCARARWKYIRRFGDRAHAGAGQHRRQPEQGLCCCGSGWAEQPSRRRSSSTTCVFDPNEAHNLAADPRLRRRSTRAARARSSEWMRETDDPLLDGPVAPPPGAEFNDPDQLSAAEPTHSV